MPLSTNLGHSNHGSVRHAHCGKERIDHAPILIALGCQILHYARGDLFCKVFPGIERGKYGRGGLRFGFATFSSPSRGAVSTAGFVASFRSSLICSVTQPFFRDSSRWPWTLTYSLCCIERSLTVWQTDDVMGSRTAPRRQNSSPLWKGCRGKRACRRERNHLRPSTITP